MLEGFVANFHFIRPGWLLLLLLLPLCWKMLSRGHSGISQWARSINPALLDVLLDQSPSRSNRSLTSLITLALLVTTLALAGPSWSQVEQPVQQRKDPLVIILDLSLSMLTQDVKPSRIVRARQKIADILRLRREGLTGLVVYAGDAHTVTPLTDDTKTIENLLGSLHPDMMPVLGSHPGMAVQLAQELMHNSAMNRGRILLITDGVDDISDVTQHASVDFPLSVLGIGTAAGGPIPLDFLDRAGQFLKDQQGTKIITRLDAERLSKVARLSHGGYHGLTLSDDDIEMLLPDRGSAAELSQENTRTFDVWEDRGYLLMLLLLPLCLLAFRRGAVLILLLFVLPVPAHASLWNDLWLRSDQQGYRALLQGEPETAVQLFHDDYHKGLAEYRAGDYDSAVKHLGRANSLPQKSHKNAALPERVPAAERAYNLGNALARAGKYKKAIAAYDKALALRADHADAAFNKALVAKLLKEKQSSSGNKNQQQQNSGKPEDSTRNQHQNQQQNQSSQGDEGNRSGAQQKQRSPQQKDNASRQANGSKGKPEQRRNNESEEEKQQALEQWLRRVPDDPGGLLRRKFRHETNEKLRSGEFRRPNGARIW